MYLVSGFMRMCLLGVGVSEDHLHCAILFLRYVMAESLTYSEVCVIYTPLKCCMIPWCLSSWRGQASILLMITSAVLDVFALTEKSSTLHVNTTLVPLMVPEYTHFSCVVG